MQSVEVPEVVEKGTGRLLQDAQKHAFPGLH
jgi:hypothetical protein